MDSQKKFYGNPYLGENKILGPSFPNNLVQKLSGNDSLNFKMIRNFS